MQRMQLERNKDSTYNVWLTRDEYEQVVRHADDYAHEIAIRLMGEAGLRVAEVTDVSYSNIKRSNDGSHYWLAVESGKDTTGEYRGGKYRETWLSQELERQIYRYTQERDIDENDPLIPVNKRAIQYWVKKAADAAADETDDPDYRKVSAHDLRRSWAHDLLVERGIGVRIVMSLGGWSSYDAIEPYLTKPSESNIISEMRQVEL